jgi:hypothetical protein
VFFHGAKNMIVCRGAAGQLASAILTNSCSVHLRGC